MSSAFIQGVWDNKQELDMELTDKQIIELGNRYGKSILMHNHFIAAITPTEADIQWYQWLIDKDDPFVEWQAFSD